MIRLCAFADEAAKELAGQLRIMKENGVFLLELRSIDGINVAKMSRAQAADYKAEIDNAGVSVFSIGSPLGKADISCDFEEYKKTIAHVYDLAEIFGAENVRVFSFFNAYGNAEEVVSRLQYMADAGRARGLNICHENEKEIFGDTLSRVQYLQSRVKGLKYIYDPANFIQCGEKAADTLSALAADAFYFHIKDVIAATGELVPAGEGDGDIAGLVGGIKGDKVLTLEPHLRIFSGYGEIDNAEMKNKRAFRSNEEAFAAAAAALKKILADCGYREKGGSYGK